MLSLKGEKEGFSIRPQIFMNNFKKRIYFIGTFLALASSQANAILSYRCEHQASQNAAQFPMDSYFYITYDQPAVFNNYKILSFHKDKLNSVLEYTNGSTLDSAITGGKVVVTDWRKFRKQFNLFKNEMNNYLSVEDKSLALSQNLNLDFLSKINEPAIYHSIQLRQESKKLRQNPESISFQFVRPDTDIEKTTLLPGDKVEYKIANKNILFNERTGMLLQVEVRINTSFLRYVFVCRTWDVGKIPMNYQQAGLKRVDGRAEQFRLLEDDLVHSKGQFSSVVYDLIFRAISNQYSRNLVDEKEKNDNKIKIIHALMKSEVIKDYMNELNSNSSAQDPKDEIKKQLLIFSQHHLPREYAALEVPILAKVYEDMYEILYSYTMLLKKGYK